jgi:protein-disulfide isomerase
MLKSLRMLTLGASVACAAVLGPVQAQSLTDAQKKEVQEVIKDYLLKNPEIIQETLIELDRRQRDAEVAARQKALKELGPQLASSKFNAVAGNPQGDVTIVEFFDYNCGFCKRGLTDLQRLMKDDPKLKVVLKDLPILSAGSRDAAAVALALKSQVKPEVFWDFHVKLMSKTGQIGKAQALEVAKSVGADVAALEKETASPEIASAFEESRKLADALGMSGTPAYVIADEVVIGAVGYDKLKEKVLSVRKCGKTEC